MTVVARLGPRDFRPQPWKNGGGITTELAVFPASGRPLWRVSVAEVAASGPFSDFSGYERTIMLLEGEGMRLVFDAAPEAVIDTAHRPFVFDGAWKCHCHLLGGAVRDLNLVVDRAQARGAIEVLRGDSPRGRLLGADWSLFHPLVGNARVIVEGREHALAAGELLRLDGAPTQPVSFRCDGPDAELALVTVERQRP
jgi:uncharacterized protein